MLKPPKSFTEQVEILSERGMLIHSVLAAERHLSRRNYYRLNAYFHHFLVEDKYSGRISFEDVMLIEEFDSVFRHYIFSYLESIELRLRTQIGYATGMKFGADAFYTGECFYKNNREDALALIAENHEEILLRYNKNPVIRHHKNRYGGQLPVWVTVEFLSFGDLSKVYGVLDGSIQTAVANDFGVQTNLFRSWIRCLSVFRNICAHHGYLFRRKLDIQAVIPREFMNSVRNNEIFTVIFCINSLSTKVEQRKFRQGLINFEEYLNSAGFTNYRVRLGDYGFPANWREILVKAAA